MKYMLLIHVDEKLWEGKTDTDRQAMYGEYRDLIGGLSAKGQCLAGSELQPTTTATSVRVRGGKRLVTDGPFAETREQLGGYFLVEAQNLDEAIDIAARIPSAKDGTVEVRPLMDMSV